VSGIEVLGGAGAGGKSQSGTAPPHVMTETAGSQRQRPGRVLTG